jgi:hypothetical protein
LKCPPRCIKPDGQAIEDKRRAFLRILRPAFQNGARRAHQLLGGHSCRGAVMNHRTTLPPACSTVVRSALHLTTRKNPNGSAACRKATPQRGKP